MSGIASQITSLMIVYSTLYPGADQRKHQSPASLAFVRGIHRGRVNSPHKWPVTRKLFPFDDVIMLHVSWGQSSILEQIPTLLTFKWSKNWAYTITVYSEIFLCFLAWLGSSSIQVFLNMFWICFPVSYLKKKTPAKIYICSSICLIWSQQIYVLNQALAYEASDYSHSPPHTREISGKQFFYLPTFSTYRKISNISRTKSPNLDVSRLVVQLSFANPTKPGVKWRMKI